MTDNEIIKALEHCAGDGYSCTGCAYDKLDYSGDYHCCDYYLKQAALGIINRQQAEIEICSEVIERQDKEIEKLNEFANERLDKFTERYDRNLKAEAIKEFADRIIKYIDVGHLRPPTEICLSDLDVRQIIEKIAKEMVGIEND